MALKDRRRKGVLVKRGTAPQPPTEKPWPDDKPPGGKLPPKSAKLK